MNSMESAPLPPAFERLREKTFVDRLGENMKKFLDYLGRNPALAVILGVGALGGLEVAGVFDKPLEESKIEMFKEGHGIWEFDNALIDKDYYPEKWTNPDGKEITLRTDEKVTAEWSDRFDYYWHHSWMEEAFDNLGEWMIGRDSGIDTDIQGQTLTGEELNDKYYEDLATRLDKAEPSEQLLYWQHQIDVLTAQRDAASGSTAEDMALRQTYQQELDNATQSYNNALDSVLPIDEQVDNITGLVTERSHLIAEKDRIENDVTIQGGSKYNALFEIDARLKDINKILDPLEQSLKP